MHRSVQSLCLTGKGKGRIEHARGRYVFNYQSLLDIKKALWSVGFELPVIGQEMLHVSYNKSKTFGTFARRLSLEAKQEAQKKLLRDFFDNIYDLLHLVSIKADQGKASSWEMRQNKDELILKNGDFHLKAFSFKDGHFYRTIFKYQGSSKSVQEKMTLQLFSHRCTAPQT